MSSKLPLAPATVTAASLPITWAQTIRVASGSTGLTLPGMMLDPGWRSGRWISARPVLRAGRHPAQVVADLGEADRDGPEHAAELDERVAGALGLEVVAGLGERLAGGLAQLRDDLLGEAGRGVDAGADRGAAEGQLADAGQDRLEPLDAVAHGGGVAAELLAEHHRGRVHQVGAARLHHVGELLGLALEARGQVLEGGHQVVGDRDRRGTWIAVGKVSLLDWLALTWSLGCTSTPARVARVAITSFMFMLELVPEPVWKTSIGNSASCSPSTTARAAVAIAFGLVRVDHAELAVDLSRPRP